MKDSLVETSQKPKVKDYTFNARRAQELTTSEKAFITIVSRNVEGYWSSADDDEVRTGRNMCLTERQLIECDEGYRSSCSEGDDEDAEPNVCYMVTNDPLCRSIVQQVRSMVTENDFDLSLCEPYLT